MRHHSGRLRECHKRIELLDCILHFSFLHSLHERIFDEDSFKVPADELRLGDLRHEQLHWWTSFGENHSAFYFSKALGMTGSLKKNHSIVPADGLISVVLRH